MAKKNSQKAKKLEALEKAQRINSFLESSTIETEALLNSAGESRPTDESHVLDLLEQDRLSRAPPPESKGAKKPSRKR